MRWKELALVLVVVVAAAGVIIGIFYDSLFYSLRDVSVGDIVSNPQSFDGVHVRLCGYVVNVSGYMFGPRYILRDFDEGVEIALGGKGSPGKVDLEPYVSFVFDGENYTQIRNIWVSVVGHVRYIGPVIDAPSFYVDVEKVEPNLTELENIVMDFLKITDVANVLWDNSVKIIEVYDHKLGGKVVVVNYITVNAVHPHFMCLAIEHHTAVITINEKGEVVSAFCVWGNFHGGEVWDLVNQRWIQK